MTHGHTTPPRLILGSTSPARTALLHQAGIAHTTEAPTTDEKTIAAAAGPLTPPHTALLLARAKAEAVANRPESIGALILGCDSIFEFEGTAYGKPHQPDIARERMTHMSGRHGILHTGHWLIDHRGTSPTGTGALSSATVHFSVMDTAEIEAYIATGEPLEVAGSFTLDGLGGAFIERVEGDPHAVVGLSVATLRTLLIATGVALHELWDLNKKRSLSTPNTHGA